MRRAGFTLLELILALGLLSILIIALVQLLDTSLTIWDRTEVQRDVTEMGLSVVELLVADVSAIDGGPRGDLLGEWVQFDTDGDGVPDTLMPRMRLVRQASAVELLRIDPDADLDPREVGLIEVCWALLPTTEKDPDYRPVGVLWRGERRIDDEETLSFFDGDFFDSKQRPVPGSLNQVTGGVLYLSILYAGQTSIVREGWKRGGELADAASSWDAWNRRRPDPEITYWNQSHPGMPRVGDHPILPRRVQVTLEIERPAEVRRRTRIDEVLEADTTTFLVRDDRRLPPDGTFLRVGSEWMELLDRSGTTITVRRGARGSRAGGRDFGELVHHGVSLVHEIPVAAYREDWNL
jgi:prepilin-type N-terminal cleavage/methylation domain-containing protein